MKTIFAIAACSLLAACSGGPSPSARGEPGVETYPGLRETVALESDGWLLTGSWRQAMRDGAGPGVLMLHRAAGDRGEYDGLADALAARGISSLALDLRGHGDSVNLGRFEPPYADNLYINEGAYRDVIVALDWLAAKAVVDEAKLAVVAGSYSGEAAALALREGAKPVAAAVMLSPGSFSDESIQMAEKGSTRWLFVRSQEEGPASKPYIDAVHEALDEFGPSLEQKVLRGGGHASELFEGRPELAGEIADWIAGAVEAPKGGA